MADSFAHLHVHTEYSILDGAARLKDLFGEAKRLDMPAIAMTDHGNLHGAYDFFTQAKQFDITPLIGVEAYKTPGTHRGEKRKVKWGSGGDADVGGGGAYTHMTILAENAIGLRNLIKLVSRSSLEGQIHAGRGYAPRVDEELLAEHAEGLIVTTGCMGGEVHTWLRLGRFDNAVASAGRLVEIFGRDNVFLEIMDHGIADERAVRADLLRLGKQVGLRPLATNDSHYVTADQAQMHDVLLCVQTGNFLAETKRFRFDGSGYHLKSAAEMRALWDDAVPGACDNTLLIAERVTPYDEVFAPRQLMPTFPVPDGHTEESWLRHKFDEGLRRRFAGRPIPPAYDQRGEFEIQTIVKMGFPSYFLIVEDFIGWAKGQGIVVGPGRGSAAGSLVAYALGITDLDPIVHGLLFERFLNPERVTMPDVDIDFDPARRGEVIEYVTRRWGADRVAQIATFGTIKAKAAIKDAARVLQLPPHLANRMTGLLPKAIAGREPSLACVDTPDDPRYDDAGELRQLIASDEQAGQIFATGRKIEGYLRQIGVHAAGVLMSPMPLTDVLPVWMRYKDGLVVTQWDMGTVEALGLLKMDFLGLRNLTVIDEALRNIEANRGTRVELPYEQLDDAATFALMARGDTLGVFQLDGGPIRSLLRAMRPTCFEDISAVLALYRPGPMGVDAHLAYADRKNGRAPVEPIHPELAEPLADILGPTNGVIVYQEQVQKIAQAVAGYTLARADLLRRAMGKKKPEVLAKEFVPFRDGMRERGYSDEAIQKLWDTLVPFADYAFNKCVSGDTVIARLGRGSHEWTATVRTVANRIHGREDYDGTGCRYCYTDAPVSPRAAECRPCRSWRAKWRMNGGMNAAGRVGDRILPVKIVDVFRQGVKPVWRVTLADGKTITSTANHRHLTPDGWRRTDQLTLGDPVCVMGAPEPGRLTPRSVAPGSKNWVALHGYYVAERAHGKRGPFLHGRNALLRANTALLERVCANCGTTEGRLERAHLDGNPLNNERDNLAYLCNSCHKRHDYANGGRVKMWRKGRPISASRVVAVEYVGEQMTYDVTVDSADHSWVANDGVVTHNSHTAAYGLISYWTAYLKANYPAEYMAALLTSCDDDTDRRALYLGECRRMGIQVLTPDINASNKAFTAVGRDVRFGLLSIKDVGTGVVDAILRGRAERGEATSFADWLTRTDPGALQKKAIVALITAGAFDSLGHSRRGLTEVYEDAVDAVGRGRKQEAHGQGGLFDLVATDGGIGAVSVDVPTHEWPQAKLLTLEREVLGLYVSGHPLAQLQDLVAAEAKESIAELLAAVAGDEDGVAAGVDQPAAFVDGQFVQIAGVITAFERKISKAGKPFVVMTVEDRDGAAITVLLFSKTLDKLGPAVGLLGEDVVVTVRGRLKIEDGEVKIFGNDVGVLESTDAARRGAPRIVLKVPAEAFTREKTARLRELADVYPGQSPVLVRMWCGPERKESVLLLPLRLNYNLHLVREISELFGPNSLAA